MFSFFQITENDLEHGTECLHLALEYTGTKAKLLEAPDTVWKVMYALYCGTSLRTVNPNCDNAK